MKGIDSDNGSELKNTQLLQWCNTNNVIFTRSRSHKNKLRVCLTANIALSYALFHFVAKVHKFINPRLLIRNPL